MKSEIFHSTKIASKISNHNDDCKNEAASAYMPLSGHPDNKSSLLYEYENEGRKVERMSILICFTSLGEQKHFQGRPNRAVDLVHAVYAS